MTLTADWSVEYNGVIVGAGTSYKLLVAGTSIGGLPITRTADQPRGSAHGIVASTDRLGGRTITLALACTLGSSSVWTTYQAFRNAWTPASSDQPLDLRMSGLPQNVMRFYGRPRDVVEDVELWSRGLIRWLATFQATDPKMYGILASGSGTSYTVTNSGASASDRITVTLTGDGGTPLVTNATTGKTIRFASTVAAGASRVLDVRARTCVDGSGVDKRAELSNLTTWLDLSAGANSITVTGAASAQLEWRPAWL